MVAPPHYKHYPRSLSWQVASVLNPSLQISLPTSQLSSHSREKRERDGAKADEKSQVMSTAFKAWQQEEEEGGERVTLPPQYVSPGERSKAMPKYIRLKVRPKSNGAGQPVAFPTATATDPVNPYSTSPALTSPRYDLAAGFSRSHDSSGRIRSAMTSPMPLVPTKGYKAISTSTTLLWSKLNSLVQFPSKYHGQ